MSLWDLLIAAMDWLFRSIEKCACVFLLGLIAIGCTPNAPYRTAGRVDCTTGDDCSATFFEHHVGFELAYVEFTDHGNVFSRERMQQVLTHISELARFDPSDPERGVIVVVFVHGWKHNARADDTNVRSFREWLRQYSC